MSIAPGLVFKKIPLLLAWTYAGQIAHTPPTPSSRYEEPKERTSDPVRDLARNPDKVINVIQTVGVWATALSEIALICALYFPSSSSARIIALLSTPSALESGSLARVFSSDIFLLGWLLTIGGTLVRLRCYRALGRQFTPPTGTSTRDDDDEHRLVTHGPYRIVRHPAYAGAILVSLGELLVELGSGSWLREAGLVKSSFGWLLGQVWIMFHLAVIGILVRRTWTEDKDLQATFGKQWVEWSKMTPYKLISQVI